MYGDARRGEQSKHRVGRVVEERVGEQPTRRRDESRGVAAGGLGGDDSEAEHAAEGRRVVESGVRMHVNVIQTLGGACEEELPERCKWEWGSGQEHEGDFLDGFGARVDPGSKSEEWLIIIFI